MGLDPKAQRDDPFIRLEKFLRDRLPVIVAGKPSLEAVFVTPRFVGSYKSGRVEIGKRGLAVTVCSGGYRSSREYLGVCALAATSDIPMRNPLVAENVQRTVQAEEDERDQVMRTLLSCEAIGAMGRSGPALAVIAFEDAVPPAIPSFIQRLRQERRAVHVVIVTCRHGRDNGRDRLASLITDGMAQEVIIVEDCTAVLSMRDIIKGLVAAWPGEPVATAASV